MLFLAIRVTALAGCSKNNNVFIRKSIKRSNWKSYYKKIKNSVCRISGSINSVCRISGSIMERTISISIGK